MASKSQSPATLIGRMFESHPEAIHEGLLDPESEKLSFTVIINGIEQRGGIERSVGAEAIKTIVYVDLEQGILEGDYHSRNYRTDTNGQWAKRDLFGPESIIEDREARQIDGVEFPCVGSDIAELTRLLTTARVVTVAHANQSL